MSAQSIAAQDSTSARLIAGTLSGVVLDTLGNPIGDADVVLTESRRQVRTGADGRFRFDNVKTAKYRVSARRIGYVAASHEVSVSDAGAHVEIRMIPIGVTIAAVTVVAEIGGVSGVIADTAFRPLQDVEVSVLGAAKSTKTDSAGKFFIPLKTGQYMLRIERDGFARQTKSVMIPENEGRKIAVWLAPRSGPPNYFESNALFDLNQSIMRNSPASTKYFTTEEMVRLGLRDLSALARNWAQGSITPECEVAIGGYPNLKIPLAMLLVSEVEFVQVFLPSSFATAGQGNRGVTSMSGRPTKFTTPTSPGRPGPKRECGNLAITAWLKQ